METIGKQRKPVVNKERIEIREREWELKEG